jgi:hypothetical protein
MHSVRIDSPIQHGFFSCAFLGIVAEDADHYVSFQSRDMSYRDISSSSISSLWDQVEDPFDFSVYMDKVGSHLLCR